MPSFFKEVTTEVVTGPRFGPCPDCPGAGRRLQGAGASTSIAIAVAHCDAPPSAPPPNKTGETKNVQLTTTAFFDAHQHSCYPEKETAARIRLFLAYLLTRQVKYKRATVCITMTCLPLNYQVLVHDNFQII